MLHVGGGGDPHCADCGQCASGSQWQVSTVAGDAGAGHLCPSACANTGLFPSEESPGHMFRLPIVCSETGQHHAPRVCRAAHDSHEGEERHQMVLIIRKSGHIRAVTRCHEDVTTLCHVVTDTLVTHSRDGAAINMTSVGVRIVKCEIISLSPQSVTCN